MTKNAPCTLNVIRKNNLNKLIFAHVNNNSVRNKFNMLASQVKGSADVVMISETKQDDTFSVDQFVLEGFSKPFRIDRNKNRGNVLLFVREDIPARLISIEKVPIESFFIELNLRKNNWIVNFSYIPYKSNISSHLEVIRRTMNIYSSNYDNFIFFGDFNADVSDKAMLDLKNLIKQPNYFKNLENSSCIDLFLTNRPRRFWNS